MSCLQIYYIFSKAFEIIAKCFRSVIIIDVNDRMMDHLDAVLCSMALLCVEVGHDQVLTAKQTFMIK